MPAIAVHPPDPHSDLLFTILTRQHGADQACAAYLRVHGRRALHAYNHALGRELDVLVPLFTAAVGAWVDERAGDRTIVSRAADQLDQCILPIDYPAKLLKKKAKKQKHLAT